MNAKTPANTISGISPPGFDPEATFLCGQCFRWTRTPDGHWLGLTGKHAARLVAAPVTGWRLADTSMEAIATTWIPYLDWQSNYTSWQAILSDGDPVMSAAIAHAPGLYLLRQDPWETLATFLISQNNGIPRIRRIVETMCACFGEPPSQPPQLPPPSPALPPPQPPSLPGMPLFPSVERIAALSEDALSVCRAGYRTGYLIKTARQLADGEVDLSALGNMPYHEARASLLRLHGVGVKVADCALLFSGLHREAFPVDRWVVRVMNALYPESGKDTASLQRYAAHRWGTLAGLAQEYLFHYARAHRIGV